VTGGRRHHRCAVDEHRPQHLVLHLHLVRGKKERLAGMKQSGGHCIRPWMRQPDPFQLCQS
jgi:hypothetical protein